MWLDLVTASEVDRVSDDRRLGLVHESLIHYWERLRRWLAENREARQVHRHLRETAAVWQQHSRDVSLLYRGRALAQARACAQQEAMDVNALEQEFLQASLTEQLQETAVQESQRQHDHQMRQRMQSLVLLFTVPLCAAVIGAVAREFFFQMSGSFLQPLPPWEGQISSEAWNGFFGTFVGAFYVTLAFESLAYRRNLSMLLRMLVMGAIGFVWGASLFFVIGAAYNAQDLEKIGWIDSNVQYTFIVTGTLWSCGLALGNALADVLARRRQQEIVWIRSLCQGSVALLFSCASPFVLSYILKDIASEELFARAWGEALGQWVSLCGTLLFYALLKYEWLSKQWLPWPREDALSAQERLP